MHGSMQKQLGVTLMELIVTLAILGILAAIGTPMLLSNLRAAKNTEAQNTLSTIFMMQKNYFAENYCYYISPNVGDQTVGINQYLLASPSPNLGPIKVGAANDFYFYIVAGPLGAGGSCSGSNSNDFVAHAQSRTNPTITFSITQQNIKTGF